MGVVGACIPARLGQVQARTVTAIVIVPVHMKDFLFFDRQQPRKDALRQTCP